MHKKIQKNIDKYTKMQIILSKKVLSPMRKIVKYANLYNIGQQMTFVITIRRKSALGKCSETGKNQGKRRERKEL